MNRSFRAMSLAIALAASAQTHQAMAQSDAASSYPGKSVTIIIGFPPGTATDSVGRVLRERLSQRLGQRFVIDNKPGQGGSMGAAAGARAIPDGYTLLLSATAALVINQHLYQKLTYDSTRDFAPIRARGRNVRHAGVGDAPCQGRHPQGACCEYPEPLEVRPPGSLRSTSWAWPVLTPAPIIDKPNRELNAVLDEPATQRRLLAMGAEILKGSQVDFSSHIRSEQEKWGKRVREAGVKIE